MPALTLLNLPNTDHSEKGLAIINLHRKILVGSYS